jgi:hypothetical protein
MNYPVTLRATPSSFSSDDVLIGDPNSSIGLVAVVRNKEPAVKLFVNSPEMKFALEAILRVTYGCGEMFASIEAAFEEVRSIAEDALSPLRE